MEDKEMCLVEMCWISETQNEHKDNKHTDEIDRSCNYQIEMAKEPMKVDVAFIMEHRTTTINTWGKKEMERRHINMPYVY